MGLLNPKDGDFAKGNGAPKRYWGMFRSNYPKDWPLDEPWIGDPWAVSVIGTVGSGKTHFATALLNETMAEVVRLREERIASLKDRDLVIQAEATGHPACAWKSVPSLIQDSRGNFDNPVYVRAAEFRGFLLLDDLGAERPTEFALDALNYILTSRFNNLLPTILTANAETLKDFDAFDPRISSRLATGIVETIIDRDWRFE